VRLCHSHSCGRSPARIDLLEAFSPPPGAWIKPFLRLGHFLSNEILVSCDAWSNVLYLHQPILLAPLHAALLLPVILAKKRCNVFLSNISDYGEKGIL